MFSCASLRWQPSELNKQQIHIDYLIDSSNEIVEYRILDKPLFEINSLYLLELSIDVYIRAIVNFNFGAKRAQTTGSRLEHPVFRYINFQSAASTILMHKIKDNIVNRRTTKRQHKNTHRAIVVHQPGNVCIEHFCSPIGASASMRPNKLPL